MKNNLASVADAIYLDLTHIQQHRPIIHHLTNFVVMQSCANILLSLGASPIMAHATPEIKDISALAQGLVINIGTLDEDWLIAMKQAQQEAILKKTPIVLDPVGAGASAFRNHACQDFLKAGVTVLRGNASEILALYNDHNVANGIDSKHMSTDAIIAGSALSEKFNCIVIISGQSDVLIQKKHIVLISHGTPLFTKVTGMGCALTSVIAAFLAINRNHFAACLHAITAFTIAGEIAEKKSSGPGTFQPQFIDSLFHLTRQDFNHLNIEENNVL